MVRPSALTLYNVLQWSRTLTSAEISCFRHWRTTEAQASMEPHSYECGNKFSPRPFLYAQSCFNGAALLRVRKWAVAREQQAQWIRLQWSRTLTSAEMRMVSWSSLSPIRLQWSRTLTSAEICKWCPAWGGGGLASMEPHSYECGNFRARQD